MTSLVKLIYGLNVYCESSYCLEWAIWSFCLFKKSHYLSIKSSGRVVNDLLVVDKAGLKVYSINEISFYFSASFVLFSIHLW